MFYKNSKNCFQKSSNKGCSIRRELKKEARNWGIISEIRMGNFKQNEGIVEQKKKPPDKNSF